MMKLTKLFCDRVSAYMIHSVQVEINQPVLVGISGGIDSVVLLDVLCDLGYNCEAVHVNFQLRGDESDKDESFIVELCKRQSLPLHIHQACARSYATRMNISVMMAARDIRYRLFTQTAIQRRIPSVAVGHHSNDQSESLLINLNRGTGPEGIAGMRPSRLLDDSITLIRPLLAESRKSIQEYADLRNLRWREDTSNQDEIYQRSRIRFKVIPHLNSASLARSSNLVRQWVDEVILPMIDEHFSAASEGQSLKIAYLNKLPDVLAHRLIIEGLRKWLPEAPADETLALKVMELIGLQIGKRIEVGDGAIWRDRRHLVFTSSIRDPSLQNLQLFPGPTPIVIAGGQLKLNLTDTKPKEFICSDEAWFDAEKLDFPLMVRNWQPGDRIHPLGMQGTKKVSDFLTDVAVPVSLRADVVVVFSGDTIAWIVGHRISHKFRITKSTNRYARLCFKRN
ncbi:MAG: tRNA lysidine(34) synthetase TilS [Bacteroidetes bacterium]|nr:tRNA lysidine(34) synthetase TilS [Bacteroidota bacterium]